MIINSINQEEFIKVALLSLITLNLEEVWKTLIIIIVMGSLSYIFKKRVVPIALIGLINGYLYHNNYQTIGSIMSMIVVYYIYLNLNDDKITQFMSYLVVVGFSILISPYNNNNEI